MRKLVVLLAIVALVSSVTAVLAGCGPSAPTDQPAATPAATQSAPPVDDSVSTPTPTSSAPTDQPAAAPAATPSAPPVDDSVSTPTPTSSAPTDQPAAAPTETVSPLLTPPATESTPTVDDSVPTPAPASSDGDGIEFAPVDFSGTSRKEEPIRVVGSDSPQKGGSGATGPVEGEPYTWQDGDRTMTVKLQTDLVVEKESGGLPLDVVSANEGGTNVVRSSDGQSKSDTLPVFRSESGGLMTLPGGVLLVLSP